jgi:hypothetical protein
VNDALGIVLILIDSGSLSDQLRGEWIHLTSLAVFSAVAYLLKRNINASDERLEEVADTLRDHTKELASHARQIRDTRAAVGCCETALKIQHYPYTD